MSPFFRYFIFVVPVTFVICLVLLLIAIFQDTKHVSKSKAMLNLFLSIMSFLGLLAVVGSIIYLGYIGLRSWVFKDALPLAYFYEYNSTPPTPYLGSKDPFTRPALCNEKTTECPLAEQDKFDLANWATNYDDWKITTKNDLSLSNRKDIIDVLSVFLVALPLFLLFLWLMEKKHRKLTEKSNVRTVYYYGVSFLALGAGVISIGILINVGLKIWFLPPEKQVDNFGSFARPMPFSAPLNDGETIETRSVEQLLSCAKSCVMIEEYEAKLTTWKQDYKNTLDKQKSLNQYHDEYATTLPIILVTSLVFCYHFLVLRMEGKET